MFRTHSTNNTGYRQVALARRKGDYMTQGIITGYSHINLPVQDMAESIVFYTEILGFSLLRKWNVNGKEAAYVCFQGILFELTTPSRPAPADEDRTETRLGFTVNNLDAALDAFRKAGVTIAREPWDAQTFWGRQAYIVDPSGYILALREWRAPDGPSFTDWVPAHEGVVRLD
jgi:catechol 2,3-dioxygenase-like lactoylglutathione lyase family enzyme